MKLENFKKCGACKIIKLESNFYVQNGVLSSHCKPCYVSRVNGYKKKTGYKATKEKSAEYYRKNILKARYGITPEQYEEMAISQNYKCAICEVHADKLSKKLAVDHDHKTGNIRGLLCSACNIGIGNLKDDVEIVRKAVNYLMSYEIEGGF